jgi:hypothetical protein
MKNLDLWLQERRRTQQCGQLNSIEDPSDEGSGDEEYVPLEGNAEACVFEFILPSGSSEHTPQQELHSSGSIELNNIESSTAQTCAWYLDSGATLHVSGNSNIYHSLRHTSGNNLRSAGGHGHSVTGNGNVHFQFPSGDVKSIPEVMYSPSIKKNLLFIGFIAD